MKIRIDHRVNTSFISFKQYFLLFFILLAVTGSYSYVLVEYFKSDRGDSFILPFALFGNLLFTNLVVCILLAFSRKINYERPIRKIAESARRIAEGDFSARVPSFRKDGNKDELEILVDDFNKMAKELSSIETLKNDFVANVSHEIKTPLNTIQSHAMALQNSNLTTELHKEYTQTIVTASQKLSTLVTNILKLNKLENQEILSVPDAYNLGEQLRCCALVFEDQWEAKNINFEADIEDIMICADASLLDIVWNNLISNAIKFTNNGGEVKISVKQSHNSVVVSIQDTGCGMDEETTPHIFDKFFQGDTSHSCDGNGLGLAMVKKVINIINGEIVIDTQSGVGTTFTVLLKP
jgi:signal transduction histidine kinase